MRKLTRLSMKLYRATGRNVCVIRHSCSGCRSSYLVYDLDKVLGDEFYHCAVIGRFFTVLAVEQFLLTLFR